jgi:urea transport system ATP-binding protein
MLRVEDLHVHYGASHALRGVSLQAVPGEITCVLGHNGVGKTTLLRAILGQVRASRGKVRFARRRGHRHHALRRARLGIATVPQGREIFARLTVKENLETGFAAAPRGTRRVIPTRSSPCFRSSSPCSAGAAATSRAASSSSSRSPVPSSPRPKVLLLDEPTEGIQPSVIKEIERVIRQLATRGDMAIVLVEQYFDFARDLASRFCVMDRGEVVLAGRPGEVDEADVRRWLTV